MKITQEQVKAVLHYDPETGIFRRKNRGYRQTGSPDRGYLKISVNSYPHYAHRLAWIYMYGKLPEGEIDHINHDRADNRIANLRAVNKQGNARNQSPSTKTKLHGVYVEAGKWRARIKIDGRFTHLGYFDTLLDAAAARKSAELWHGFHANHGRAM